MTTSSIILIGPLATGKSTIGELLAEALGRTWIELDALRWAYYAEIGYDQAKAEQLRGEGGFQAVGVYWKPFEIHAVERVLAAYPTDHVISFGAGHSIYDDPALLERAKTALANFPIVILLLPSTDASESRRILRERFKATDPDISDDEFREFADVIDLFVGHPSNARLATLTIYTVGKTPAETCAEIIERLKLRSN